MKLTKNNGKQVADLTADGVRLEYDGKTTATYKWGEGQGGGGEDPEARQLAQEAMTKAEAAEAATQELAEKAVQQTAGNPVALQVGFVAGEDEQISAKYSGGTDTARILLNTGENPENEDILIESMEGSLNLIKISAAEEYEHAGESIEPGVLMHGSTEGATTTAVQRLESDSRPDGTNPLYLISANTELSAGDESGHIKLAYKQWKTSNPQELARDREITIDIVNQVVEVRRNQETRTIDLWNLAANSTQP